MQPERVDPTPTEQPRASPRKRFEELLRARTDRPVRKGPAPPRHRPTVAPARGARSGAPVPAGFRTTDLRGMARAEMDASARQRLDDGARATTQATARLDARAAELLRAALRTEEAARREDRAASGPGARTTPERAAEGPAPPPGVKASGVGASGGTGALPGARVERALALVERIERFVRSGRPSLALTLRGGLPGRLELQRVGPGAISIRLSSARPPSSGELGELRQALEARGLSVRSLETRALTASAADACSPCP